MSTFIEYLLMFIIFWFVCFCFTVMTIPKEELGNDHLFDEYDTTIDIFGKSVLFVLTWPVGWWFTYKNYKIAKQERDLLTEKMFINMGMEKINDPNARVSRRV